MAYPNSVEKLTTSVTYVLNFRGEEVLTPELWGSECHLDDGKEKLKRIKILLEPLLDLPLELLPEHSVTKLHEAIKPIEQALKNLELYTYKTIDSWSSAHDYVNPIRDSVERVYPVLAEHLSYLSLVKKIYPED